MKCRAQTAAAVIVATLVTGCSQQIPQGTALATPSDHGWETQQDLGVVFTDGFETLDVVSEPVQVIDVRFEGGGPGLELIGYEIVPPPRHYATIQLLPGFPPTSRELPKARVQPGESLVTEPNGQGHELLLGVKVAQEGRWVRAGVTIHYRSGGREYVQTLPAELIVCTRGFWKPDGRC